MVIQGDARKLPIAGESVDAVVTDPPYELGFMGREWDRAGVAYDPATWVESLRVLRPGGRLLAFGANRTHHRIWCAIEDAGFVIEDTIMWIYGSGFPKHRSKLKPAYEPIIVARKGPVTDLNIDECRIGVGTGRPRPEYEPNRKNTVYGDGMGGGAWENTSGRWPANIVLDEEAAATLDAQSGERPSGARAAGVRTGMGYHGASGDGGPAIEANTGGASRFFYCAKASRAERNAGLEGLPRRPGGSTAKGFTEDRERGQDRNRPVANHHPTVKPVDLMRWLVRLVTQPGELVLDPFTGSGTTGVACTLEGRRFIGVEREAEYVEIARRRIAATQPSLFAVEAA